MYDNVLRDNHGRKAVLTINRLEAFNAHSHCALVVPKMALRPEDRDYAVVQKNKKEVLVKIRHNLELLFGS